MTKEQLFKREYAQELFRVAAGDLQSAIGMHESKKGRQENICYMAQQAIEKALKSLICHLKHPIPFTHSIELLLDRLPAQMRPAQGESLIALTDFAMIRRYNEGNEIISEEDILATLKAAQDVLDWVQKLIAPLN